MYDWRSGFGKLAKKVVTDFLEEMEPADRESYLANSLGDDRLFCYSRPEVCLYRDMLYSVVLILLQDTPLPRGLFCSRIVAMTYAHHFRETKNSIIDYPVGIGALALAAAAVCFLFNAFIHLLTLISNPHRLSVRLLSKRAPSLSPIFLTGHGVVPPNSTFCLQRHVAKLAGMPSSPRRNLSFTPPRLPRLPLSARLVSVHFWLMVTISTILSRFYFVAFLYLLFPS